MSDNNIYLFHIDYHELTIPAKHIGIVLGYPDGVMPEHIRDIFREIEENAAHYCHIRGGYRLLAPETYTLNDDNVEISGKRLYTGRIISKQLKQSDFAAVFACTAGPKLEKWSKQLFADGEAVKGYMIDALGSETVELAMDQIESALAEKMQAQGFTVTNRFSPGYCGWPTNDQHTLFSLLPEEFCGISLTPTALMLPIKSVSGIIGIGSRVKKLVYPCKICEMTDCIRRTIYQME
jgi:hypothetical protein